MLFTGLVFDESQLGCFVEISEYRAQSCSFTSYPSESQGGSRGKQCDLPGVWRADKSTDHFTGLDNDKRQRVRR